MDEVESRRRVAVNLVGVDRHQVQRGAMLGTPRDWTPTRRMSVVLKTPRYEPAGFVDRGSFHVHIGTSATASAIRVIERGPPTIALIELSASRPVRVGDRLIVRDVGRRRVVGGGRVLDPHPPRKHHAIAEQGADLVATLLRTPDQIATVLLNGRRRARVDMLAAHSGGGHPINATEASGWALSSQEVEHIRRLVLARVEEHQRQRPLSAGLSTAELASQLDLPIDLLTKVLSQMDVLGWSGTLVSLNRRDGGREVDPKWASAREILAGAGLAPPPLRSLGLDPDSVATLARAGSLIRISDEIAYLPEQVEALIDVLRGMPATFTVSEFRQQAGLTRKYAVPFLEWADRREITVRVGDKRRLVSPSPTPLTEGSS